MDTRPTVAHAALRSIIQEISAGLPRALDFVQAELLFTAGGYLFHWREGEAQHYRALSPQSVRAAFATETLDSGWLLPHTIRVGATAQGNWAACVIPAAIHTLTLTASDPVREVAVTLPLPPLLFVGQHTPQPTYSVWALDSDPITPDSPIFHAPLPNVYSDGHICFGRNALPPVTAQALPAVWQLFIGSPFSTMLGGLRSRQYGTDVHRLLTTLTSDPASVYPTADLVPLFAGAGRAATIAHVLDSMSRT